LVCGGLFFVAREVEDMAEEPTQGETKPQPPAPEGTSKMGIGCVVVVVAIIVGIFVVVLIASGG